MTRVLVVNHDTDLADQEVDSLRRRGYEVLECLGPIGASCPILSDASMQPRRVGGRAWSTTPGRPASPKGRRALIEGLRAMHPEVPIVLSASGIEPDWIELSRRPADHAARRHARAASGSLPPSSAPSPRRAARAGPQSSSRTRAGRRRARASSGRPAPPGRGGAPRTAPPNAGGWVPHRHVARRRRGCRPG